MGLSMCLAGAAGAAPNPLVDELWFFEVSFAGKGYEADTDSDEADPVYIGEKHTLESKEKEMYAMYIREDRQLQFAFYDEFDQQWDTWNASDVYETADSVLVIIQGNNKTLYVDPSDTDVNCMGTLLIQFKKKDGQPASGKMKSLAMSYLYSFDKDTTGETQQLGGLKMKGKIVPQSEIPTDVRDAFGLLP